VLVKDKGENQMKFEYETKVDDRECVAYIDE
jgi:hypothetical protein